MLTTLALALAQAPTPTQDPTSEVVRALVAAPGLEVDTWAAAPMLFNPTSIDADERGRIWVAEAVNYRRYNTPPEDGRFHEEGDRITILEDTDGDGRADVTKVFVQEPDLVAPLGVAVIGDRVVVSCSPNLIVYTKDAEDRVVDREVLLTGFGGFDHDHALHAVEIGPDGRWYFNVGNAGPHVVTDRGGWTLRSGSWYTGGSPHNTRNTPGLVSDDGRVWHGGLALSMMPDGTDLRVLGHGFRNAVGTCIDAFGDLWMNDNDDTQSCRTTWLPRYADCGYDSKDGRRGWQADRRPGQSVRAAHWRQDDPGVVPSGHVYGNGAPTGICVVAIGALGAEYENGLLLSCEAGQNVVWGYRRRPQGAGFALEPFAFLRTVEPDPDYVWHERSQDRARWFRPSDVCVGHDGNVYVADWFDAVVGGHQMDDRRGSGAIYRVSAARSGVASAPHFDSRRSPAVNVRNHAWAEHRARHARGEHQRVAEELFRHRPDDPLLRAQAVWLATEPQAFLGAADPALRTTIVRRMAQLGTLLDHAEELCRDDSPAVRRELALELRGVPAEVRRPLLAELFARWAPDDRWYLEAFGTGCEGIEPLVHADLVAATPPLEWSDAQATVAWRLHVADAVPTVLERALAGELDGAARAQAIDTLAFVPTRAAGRAMVRVATEGPADLRPYARWWVEHRSTNDWSELGLLDELPARYPGAPRFQSPVLHRGGLAVDIDVTGATELWLVADDAGDGNAYDWVNWGDARLATAAGEVALSELDWIVGEVGWGALNKGADCGGGALVIGTHEFSDGLGGHADMEVSYDLGGLGATRFQAFAGVDDMGSEREGSRASVRAYVYCDGPTEAERAIVLRNRLLDPALSAPDRRAAAVSLARTAEGGSILIALAQQGALEPDLAAAAAARIFENPDLGVRALASAWFPRTTTAGQPLPSIPALAALTGDAARGRELFFSQRATCSRCHVVGGQGTEIGPDLSEVGRKLDRLALFDAILDPSAAILTGYESWTLEAADGTVLTGFLVADGESVTVRTTQGRRLSLPSAEVVARHRQKISAMPDNVGLGLSPQELADVVRFLEEVAR